MYGDGVTWPWVQADMAYLEQIFTIDALWPDVPPQYIDIVTEGNVKVAATVKGWSDYEGDVEDVTPVPVIQVKPQYRWLSPQCRLIKPKAILQPPTVTLINRGTSALHPLRHILRPA